MTLVEMAYTRMEADGPQRPPAADAEDHFLLQPGFQVAAIELAGDGAVGRQVERIVAVEQQQAHPAHPRFPDLHAQAATGQGDVHPQPGAVRAMQRRDGQLYRIVVGIERVLPALAVEHLAKVALLVEQADAHDGHAEVAGRLEVVAGQDAQAARVDGQAFVKTELGTEIGDQVVFGADVLADNLRHDLLMVGFIGRQYPLKILHEDTVIDRGLEPFLGNTPQKGFRVVTGTAPEVLVQPGKQPAHLPVPAVEQVIGKLLNPLQRVGNTRLDF